MTITDFNTKWGAYLEEGHYGLAINHPLVIVFLDEEVMPLLSKLNGFKFSQIKTKFASIRFYTNQPSWLISGIESHIKYILDPEQVWNSA